MSDEERINVRPLEGDYNPDDVWECPECGLQVSVGNGGKLSPMTCNGWGQHKPLEMEQKMPGAWDGPRKFGKAGRPKGRGEER